MPNLVADTIRQGLFTHVVGRRLLYFPQLSSTMDEAARLAREGADEGCVVVAEVQTAGRGRQGRSWVSEPGNLLASVLLRPEMSQLAFIPIIGGIAIARAVRKTTGLDPRIKWPNDLMVHGRKVAGILAESAIAGDSVCYAVLGIGVNVNLDPAQSEGLAVLATSLNAAAGYEVPREDLLRPTAPRPGCSVPASEAGPITHSRVAGPVGDDWAAGRRGLGVRQLFRGGGRNRRYRRPVAKTG